jgi:hypothetical protein
VTSGGSTDTTGVSPLQVELARWADLVRDGHAGTRVGFGLQLAEQIMRLTGDATHGPSDGVTESILRQVVRDARQIGDRNSLMVGVGLLLQAADVPLEEGEALIDEAVPGIANAPVATGRLLLIVAAEFLRTEAMRIGRSADERNRLLGRSLALLQPLLEGSFEPFIEWQHLVLAAQVHNYLGEPRAAIPLLARATTLVDRGSNEWTKAAIELGLTYNDIGADREAVEVLSQTLPMALGNSLAPSGSPTSVHRGFDLSDVASALAESLASLRDADAAFGVQGLAFIDDDGSAAFCDLSAMCAQLADDELGVLFCVNNATTMFLFDRAEALRVRRIPGASVQTWLQTIDAADWLQSSMKPGRTGTIPQALEVLNDALRGALSGLADEIDGYGSVVVIPHRTLALLPFWLLDAFAGTPLRMVPSPRLLLSSPDRPAGGELLSVADPNGDLPAARVESEAVRQRAGSRFDYDGLAGRACTVDALLRELPTARWWHFAGHARSDVAFPENSVLRLSSGPDGDDDVLDGATILQQDLSRVALAVLSACSSGVPEMRIDSVTRLAGLAALLLRQGVGTVVATMWEVGDAAAALIVDQLVAELLDEGGEADVPACLQRATERVRTMASSEAAARFQQIATDSVDGFVAAAADRAAGRLLSHPGPAPFASVERWGAFFTAGARYVDVRVGDRL